MKRMLKILTPENVNVEHELAGLGSRFAAMLLDQLILTVITVLITIIMAMNGLDFRTMTTMKGSVSSVIIAIAFLLVFIITFGYFVFFEMVTNGQTPGKKLLKLRVIKENGEPLGFTDSVLRNILRVADMLPSLYLAGAAFIVFSRNYKRIGDFAANTVVIKVKSSGRPVALDTLLNYFPEDTGETPVMNRYPVDRLEYGVLREFVERKNILGDRRPVFEYHLNRYFSDKFGFEKPSGNPPQFFEEILRMNSKV